MDCLRNDYRNLKPKKRCKSGWIKTQYHQKELLRKPDAAVVVIGGSIVGRPRRIQQYGEILFYDTKLLN